MIDKLIEERSIYWSTNSCFDSKTRSEISQLIAASDHKELTDRFYRDLEFGTGGLRGILGAGTARMNIYNIRKATCAFARYLKSINEGRVLSIAITYDSRNFSLEFAKATAETMAAHGIRALITKELRPVPMLSFLVRKFECSGGVCITASHNPPNYNGYKVYWKTGGQIVPPHDQAVIEEYARIKDYADIPHIDFESGVHKGLIQMVGEELDDLYFAQVAELRTVDHDWPDFKIAFSPLHGTAGKPVKRALQLFGFSQIAIVPEQEQPNGDFPTVKFPNPEEPAALAMVVDLARTNHSDLVLATDPDCDRVGIVYEKDGEYVFLNGNQIGCLLTEYVLSRRQDLRQMPDHPLIVKTIVTTDLQGEIGKYYGCHVDETLTGFKWICDLIEQYDQGIKTPKRQFVCGGEESYGFLVGDFVRDKDGIVACAVAAEMTAYYRSQGLTLDQVLDKIFRRHGVYSESLKTLTLPGKEGADTIRTMMTNFRSSPPIEICGTPVVLIKDIENGVQYNPADPRSKSTLDLPSSNVLQFILQDGSKVSVRPSGTEPKIKFYISARLAIKPDCSDAELQAHKQKCAQRVKELEDSFLGMGMGSVPRLSPN